MDRTLASPGRARATLGASPARRPSRLDYFLCALPLPTRSRHRPTAPDRRRFRSHTRRRPPALPARGRIHHGRRWHVPAIVRALRARHVFFLSAPVASRRLLPFLFLRTVSPYRHLHGRRSRSRFAAADGRRPRIRDPRLELSLRQTRRPRARHPNRQRRSRNRLARNARSRSLANLAWCERRRATEERSREVTHVRPKRQLLWFAFAQSFLASLRPTHQHRRPGNARFRRRLGWCSLENHR